MERNSIQSGTDSAAVQRFLECIFLQEKEVYKDILKNYGTVVSGTVEELAKKYDMEVLTMVGFLDGISESLKKKIQWTSLLKQQKFH